MLRLCLTLAALAAPDFATDQRQASVDYAATQKKVLACYAVGDLEAAQKLFLEAVPEDKRLAAHYLRMGDAFLLLDAAFARAQHAKALELAPEEPVIALACALDLHRVGRCEEAEPLYARAAARGDAFAMLLRIDCLVRAGRLEEALDAWRTARATATLSNLIRVLPERIPPGETREHRRMVLRKALAGGSSEGIEELVFLDLMRPGGPRRFEVERVDLDTDRRLVGEHLERDSRRARELWSVCDFWFALWERGFPPASAGDFAAKFSERMRELGWLEPGGELPAQPLVVRWATTALLEGGLRKPADLLADWERPLSERLDEGDACAGRALLELQRAAESQQAAETEQLLWDKTQDLEAALALLGRRADKLESGDALLRGALERYPRSVRLCTLASECARREGKGEREALARQISAAFQARGESENLQAAFERLAALLDAGQKR